MFKGGERFIGVWVEGMEEYSQIRKIQEETSWTQRCGRDSEAYRKLVGCKLVAMGRENLMADSEWQKPQQTVGNCWKPEHTFIFYFFPHHHFPR